MPDMPFPWDDTKLDPEITQRDVEASIGFGRAYERRIESAPQGRERAETVLAAASCYRRAGASAMMLGSTQAMYTAFREAGRLYESLGFPYALQMYALSGDPIERVVERAVDFRQVQGAQRVEGRAQLVYLTLFGLGPIPAGLEVVSPLPWTEDDTLGILDLPVSMYWELAASMGDHNARLHDRLRPFLLIYDANLRLASSHVQNWRLLVQRMHPAEPDIIGLLCLVFLARPETRLGEITEGVSPLAREIIEGCLNTRFNGQLFL